MMTSIYERHARLLKAQDIADHLHRLGVDADVARHLDRAGQLVAARIAGRSTVSSECWSMVIERLRATETRRW